MSTRACETASPAPKSCPHTVLEVTVQNHPGTMSHVCGLFSRRAFNVDGILCLPLGDTGHSRIWLRVQEDRRLEQLVRQMEKLADVLEVRRHTAGHEVFLHLEEFFRPAQAV
jgi:acetolactate synthase I/III small subunit